MPDLRSMLEKEASEARVSHDGLGRTLRRARQRQRNRRIVSGALALALFAASAVGLSVAFFGGGAAPAGPVGLLDQPQVMMSVHFVSRGVGWGLRTTPFTLIARDVMRTSDGGLHWRDVTPSQVTAIGDAQFLDGSVAWVAAAQGFTPGQGGTGDIHIQVFRTTDGGRSWRSTVLPFSCQPNCLPAVSISFTDPANGWIAVHIPEPSKRQPASATSELFSTTDGGATWAIRGRVPFNGRVAFGSPSVGLALSGVGVLGGAGSSLYQTDDAGRSWRPFQLPVPSTLVSGSTIQQITPPVFVGRTGVLAATFARHHLTSTFTLVPYASTDGGLTWRASNPISGYWANLSSPIPVAWRDPSTWIIPSGLGNGRLEVTHDAGVTWAVVHPSPAHAADVPFGQLDFVSADVGYAVTTKGLCIGPFVGFCAGSSTIYRTADGGQTWSRAIGIANPSHTPPPSPEPTLPSWKEQLPGEVAYKCGDSVCLMRPDGTGQRDLLPTGTRPWPQWDPAWSPDGRRIAFRGYYGLGDGQYDLYVIDASGCHLTRLTRGVNGTAPSWSPSGEEIAFASGGIAVIKPDGTGLRHLTRDTGSVADDAPSCSSTGQIAFVRYPAHHFFGRHFGEIFVMNGDGSGVRTLTSGAPGYGEPSWSPDGRQVAAVAYPGQAAVIDVINNDGSGLHRISPVTWKSFSPTWTPDGHIVFLVKRKAGIDAYIANPDGSGRRLLYSNLVDPLQIEWGPAHLPQPEC